MLRWMNCPHKHSPVNPSHIPSPSVFHQQHLTMYDTQKSGSILKILRHVIQLIQNFNGVFLKVNKATMNMLQRVKPYGLGKHKIICIEDLIHEIFSVGPYLKKANNFLWPFKLKTPLGGL
ncbi:hypothetical protein KFK09_005119 [Dendrobium nobile]|uniref:Ribosomal protein L30 ferredoxin-like fold domain-containing protein n=1 Tax=Dendrobium nobile TaxID=94219 RepID=A0A8T3BUV5_DENNO|nr:hypothetical protein KFK09_005119 [Dendrobium nobile]